MLDDGELPEPNITVRLAIEWLDRYSDRMPLSQLGVAGQSHPRGLSGTGTGNGRPL